MRAVPSIIEDLRQTVNPEEREKLYAELIDFYNCVGRMMAGMKKEMPASEYRKRLIDILQKTGKMSYISFYPKPTEFGIHLFSEFMKLVNDPTVRFNEMEAVKNGR